MTTGSINQGNVTSVLDLPGPLGHRGFPSLLSFLLSLSLLPSSSSFPSFSLLPSFSLSVLSFSFSDVSDGPHSTGTRGAR